MYHSQHEIEKYLEKFFNKPGFFLEIGCWDGELISQTAWLERERGWIGVCVDPFARGFEGRGCTVVRKAIVSPSPCPSDIPLPQGERGGREFVKVSVDRRDGGDVSYFSGFRDAIAVHWDLISQFCDYEIVEVETITLEELWREYELPAHVDFLSVDTEGSELEIFESIDFDKWHFGLIVYEHNGDQFAKERIGELLRRAGYVCVEELRVDDVWVESRKWRVENE